jgi:glycosyltransferase involved in cell wall biosynthesis
MRIAVNLRLFVKGKIGGMENYVRHIVGGIAAHQQTTNSEWTVFAHTSEIDNVRELAPGAEVIPLTHETGAATVRRELNRQRHDLLFCPLLVVDPLRLTDVPTIVTVPDLQHEYLPKFFDKRTLTWRQETFGPSLFYADVIFTISEYSKRTIVEKFRVSPDKIVVVGLDVDPEFRTPSSPQLQDAFRALRTPEKYIYYPANFWEHKNHSTLLRALKLLVQSSHPDLHLVLTGAPGADMERVRQEAANLGLSGQVLFLGYQPRELMPEIYRHALALPFVSQFEGFGIPILEAFHTGTPVLAARTTSCPEVAGDAALLVNELSAADIASGLRSVLDDDSLRRDLIEKGNRRMAQYSWKDTIKTSLEVFDRAIHGVSQIPRVEVHDHPLVSIVTPTYNMGHFLEETIQSVLSQDYPHIDYVVMDGGSTDSTLELLRKYQSRLRFVSAPDEGQADAINKGFALARGQVFAFLNADDTYLPGAVSTAVSQMTAHSSHGMVYGDGYHVHEDGTMMGAYPSRSFDYEALSHNCFICQPAAFMWRDAFAAVGGLNQSLQTALDYDLWIRIGKTYPLMKIDGFLATSRMYRENKTISRRKQVYEEIIQVVKTHYGYVPYDWLYGYAAYLIDRKDQIFEVSHPSAIKKALALSLGLYYNPRQPTRYWKEWCLAMGIGGKFTGRWTDGWISKEYDHEFRGAPDCDRIVISGRHLAPFRKGLRLDISLNGVPLKQVSFDAHGPFRIEMPCPPDARGKTNRLKITCNASFRPGRGGDTRRLSCLIDGIDAERSRSQTP